MQQMLAAFCIFRSSLVLQKLYIKAISVENKSAASADGFWEGSGEDFSCTFGHLQVVEVTGFTGIASEVKLIGFVLANAPVLERLQIKFKENVGNTVDIFRELIRFRRISPKAEIVVPA
ncbi:F-box/FBD/LRR-repeat protein-like [Iris pallida]|uniref:F-box/FBD/LRR-repeat protein-like n=1 Tax=Iris pallida TaxID=29817 RepID=A0AAX6EYC9_IRIPA|nr:F-box/FBD/LRR-repeat protein-like [Iris pallida]KAJ6809208.1 F-box/FBD/LRR-repeat protein-like [Iris pallida]